MSDDLAERLRDADRIEELEERLTAATDDAKEAEAYVEELEAKLAKAVAELERLGFDLQCIVGRELKGQDDE